MFNLAEYREKRIKLSDRLPWLALVAPGVILNKTGSLQTTLSLRGYDLSQASQNTKNTMLERLNNVLLRLGSGWAFYFEVQRRNSIHYPESYFKYPIAALIDSERKTHFEEEGQCYESQAYLTLQYLPNTDLAESQKNKYVVNEKKMDINRSHSVDYFTKQVEKITLSLRTCFLSVSILSDSEMLTYLHSTISQKPHTIIVPDNPIYLDSVLADTPLTGGLEPKLGDLSIRVLTIRFFPESTYTGLLEELNGLNMGFRWVSRWIALDQETAKKDIKKIQNNWMAKRTSLKKLISSMLGLESQENNEDAEIKYLEAQEALQLAESGRVGFGYYTGTVVVSDLDPNRSDEKIKLVESLINNLGLTCIVEDKNALEAWFGSLPGHTYANVRRPLISTLNLGCLISQSSVWAGHSLNTHLKKTVQVGDPLMITESFGNTPFRLICHQNDVGHTLLMGPTGAGKSTFLLTAMLQFFRYPKARVVMFDKGFSAKVASFAMGGAYYELGAHHEKALALQPLSNIHQKEERTWASEWVASIIEEQGIRLKPEQKKEIWEALENLSAYPVAQRTLTGLCGVIQDKALRLALMPFTLAGPYGYLLDGSEDNLADSHWICFEMELLSDCKGAIGAVLSCIFHKVNALFTGQPGMIVIDEGWTWFENPVFAPMIQKWLLESRKNNISIWFATQNFEGAQNHPLTPILLQSCKTKIFLPNREADKGSAFEFYKMAGLTNEQIQTIKRGVDKQHYYYHSAHGDKLFDLALGPIILSIVGASGKTASKQADLLLKQYGTSHFSIGWLLAHNLEWAANLLLEKDKIQSPLLSKEVPLCAL